MKNSLRRRAGEHGSALIISLTFGVILLVVLATYLTLLTSQKNLVTRSQTWNAAMTMAEAGVEEALAQINSAGANATVFSTNGWGGSGVTFGPKSVNLAGGSYSALISMASSTPTVYSTGYATVPIVGGTIQRVIKVTTASSGLLNVGLGAVNGINFNGNGVATDSYDSTKTNLSNNGQYDPSKTSTNGSIASVQGLVNPGNHTINGNLYLGPTATYSGGGTITGTIDYNYNVQFPDVQLPAGANNWQTAAPVVNFTYTTNSTTKKGVTTTTITTNSSSPYIDFNVPGTNYYKLNTSAYPIYVEPGVTVILNVTATTFNPPALQIHGGTTNSGTAVLYMNGPTSVSIAGNTAVDASNRPANLWYYGLPSMTSMTFSGNSSFVGVIYAPEVSLTLNGGGNNFGVMGSVIVGNITMNGHYNFHYDESLAKFGASRGYVATSWQELY